MPDRKKFPVALRVALWRANNKSCFYCDAPIAFGELEIDHLIAHSTPTSIVASIAHTLSLGPEFSVDDPRNLVPAHSRCNCRKGSAQFGESTLRYYVELWSKRQGRVQAEVERFKRQTENDNLLAALAARVEAGLLAADEVIQFLTTGPTAPERREEPTVVSFSVLLEHFDDVEDLELDEVAGPAQYYDVLISRLRSRVAASVPTLQVITEDDRNGETISVRIAFWNLDVERLDDLDVDPWEILEVASWSDIYADSDWKPFFPKATIQTYHAVIGDERDDLFGLARCPKCGHGNLERSGQADPRDGDMYYFVKCPACGYSDWTQ